MPRKAYKLPTFLRQFTNVAVMICTIRIQLMQMGSDSILEIEVHPLKETVGFLTVICGVIMVREDFFALLMFALKSLSTLRHSYGQKFVLK